MINYNVGPYFQKLNLFLRRIIRTLSKTNQDSGEFLVEGDRNMYYKLYEHVYGCDLKDYGMNIFLHIVFLI